MDSQSATSIHAKDRPTTRGWALVIDDHPLFCDALELTLNTLGEFSRIATANSLGEGITLLEEAGQPGLILLDLNLPDVSGLDGLIRLRRVAGDAPIVIVSSLTDNAIIGSAIVAGASGFVPKHSPRAVFRDALSAIAQGEVFTPPGYVESDRDTPENQTLARLSSLTNQQARILELICDGKLNKQIAYDLSIAEATVKAHVTAIMRKLGVQSRTQAVLAAQDARFGSILPKTE